MRTAAQADLAAIERNYNDYCENLVKLSPQLEQLSEFTALKRLEVGKTAKKIDALHEKLRTTVSKLKEGTLIKDVEDTESKAKTRDHLAATIGRQISVRQSFRKLRSARSDYRRIQDWLREVGKVTKISDALPNPPRVSDNKIASVLVRAFTRITDAKKTHREMRRLATRNKVKPESIDDRIEELSSILQLLKKKAKAGKVLPAGVTEIDTKAYAVLNLRMLAKHPSLSKISNEPIPQGTTQQKKQYQLGLTKRISAMNKIRDLNGTAETEFESFIKEDIPELNNLVSNLWKRTESVEKGIRQWSSDLVSAASSFLGTKVRARNLRSQRDVDSFATSSTRLMAKRESRYLSRLNSRLKELDIKVDKLTVYEVRKAARIIRQQRKELPGLETVSTVLEENKTEWQKREEVYSDYSKIPEIADLVISVLHEIAEKCFDSGKLKKQIAGTYNDIMKIMAERNLIKATFQMPEGELKGAVEYKDRPITHPAGSEKAFFSLAILTALAHYFQTPVLIDEVANNLDSKNLRAFFELVREFKERWSVQYVLSVKETNDFELEGWVREMSEHTEIYEITDKRIQKYI